MSTTPLGITQFGSFTPSVAQLIQAAISKQGFGVTGNIYYCDPVNGLDTNNGQLAATVPGTTQGPVQSLLAGYNLLRSGFNDALVLIGNGQSTGSARITTFTWAKNAAHLFGICAPAAISQRARIANPTTAGLIITANFFTVSGNGCLFSNLSWFQGAGAGQTGIAAAILMTITGSRNAFINCDFEGMGDTTASADAGSRNILISGGGQENYFFHCNIGLDTVQRTNANASVEIAGGGPRNIFDDCTFLMDSSDGLQYYILGNAAAALDRWLLLKNCQLINAIQSGSTAIAQMFHLAASVGGMLLVDGSTYWYGITAVGDATTKGQTYMAGVAGVNTGGKAIVAT